MSQLMTTDLELSGDQLNEILEIVGQYLKQHIDSLAEQPAWNSDHLDETLLSLTPIPETGTPLRKVLDHLFEDCLPPTYNTASPGYFAYVPGGGIPHAAVADLISNIVNRFVTVWVASPALAQIELTVVRWFCEMVGFPQSAGGFLTSGGSIANWSAMVQLS